MRCITWNLEWAAAGTVRLAKIRKLMESEAPDIACLTEAMSNTVRIGHTIFSDPDYGYEHTKGRHKVVLWSQYPWQEMDTFGSEDLPSGRFVTGITNDIRFVGVCIPWRQAHVKTGRKDRDAWQDHLAFLEGLRKLLSKYLQDSKPICVLGDFNQRVPRERQPENVFEALIRTFQKGFSIATQNTRDTAGKLLIDHLAFDNRLKISVCGFLPKTASDGTQLSDHTGVVATLDVIAPN